MYCVLWSSSLGWENCTRCGKGFIHEYSTCSGLSQYSWWVVCHWVVVIECETWTVPIMFVYCVSVYKSCLCIITVIIGLVMLVWFCLIVFSGVPTIEATEAAASVKIRFYAVEFSNALHWREAGLWHTTIITADSEHVVCFIDAAVSRCFVPWLWGTVLRHALFTIMNNY